MWAGGWRFFLGVGWEQLWKTGGCDRSSHGLALYWWPLLVMQTVELLAVDIRIGNSWAVHCIWLPSNSTPLLSQSTKVRVYSCPNLPHSSPLHSNSTSLQLHHTTNPHHSNCSNVQIQWGPTLPDFNSTLNQFHLRPSEPKSQSFSPFQLHTSPILPKSQTTPY